MVKYVVLLMVLCLGIDLQGQSKMSEEQKKEARERFEAYQEKLDLSDSQKETVEEINLSYFEGLSELKKSDLSKFSKYRKFKKLSSTRDGEMKKILSPNQFEVYRAFQEEIKDEFKAQRKNN